MAVWENRTKIEKEEIKKSLMLFENSAALGAFLRKDRRKNKIIKCFAHQILI